jgi:alanine dehydrogenase
MAMIENPEIAAGANVVDGKITHKGLADVHSLKYLSVDALL